MIEWLRWPFNAVAQLNVQDPRAGRGASNSDVGKGEQPAKHAFYTFFATTGV